MNPNPSHCVHLLYTGGTFGCHGHPLSPLPADVFLPKLSEHLNNTGSEIQLITNHIIKDSSTLTPSDFVEFYAQILGAYRLGARHFILITGTDSLSFLAAFLAYAFEQFSDISLIITGSMQPFFQPTTSPLTHDSNSDAWQNLHQAQKAVWQYHGVYVQFAGQTLLAKNTQKLHSQDANAFIGTPVNEIQIPKTNYPNAAQIDALINQLTLYRKNAQTYQTQAIYCLPNETGVLENQLHHLPKSVKVVILIGFGAGNVPTSQRIQQTIYQLNQSGVVFICASMCAFGGVNADYAAGSWQYDCGVWSSGQLTIAAIFAQALWLSLNNSLDITHWKTL